MFRVLLVGIWHDSAGQFTFALGSSGGRWLHVLEILCIVGLRLISLWNVTFGTYCIGPRPHLFRLESFDAELCSLGVLRIHVRPQLLRTRLIDVGLYPPGFQLVLARFYPFGLLHVCLRTHAPGFGDVFAGSRTARLVDVLAELPAHRIYFVGLWHDMLGLQPFDLGLHQAGFLFVPEILYSLGFLSVGLWHGMAMQLGVSLRLHPSRPFPFDARLLLFGLPDVGLRPVSLGALLIFAGPLSGRLDPLLAELCALGEYLVALWLLHVRRSEREEEFGTTGEVDSTLTRAP